MIPLLNFDLKTRLELKIWAKVKEISQGKFSVARYLPHTGGLQCKHVLLCHPARQILAALRGPPWTHPRFYATCDGALYVCIWVLIYMGVAFVYWLSDNSLCFDDVFLTSNTVNNDKCNSFVLGKFTTVSCILFSLPSSA